MRLKSSLTKVKRKLKRIASTPLGYIFLWLIVIMVCGLLIALLLPTLPKGEKGRYIGTLLGKVEKGRYIGSLLGAKKEANFTIPSLANFLCAYLYDYNQTNISLGNLTCFKQPGVWGDCICVSVSPG